MRIRNSDIIIFLILTLIVVITTLIILKPVFNTGFTSDDWIQLVYYKVYGSHPLELYKIRGAYTTTQAYYIGVLVDIFGLNYRTIQATNIFFKILATLSIYPLVLLAFKRKLLAFLTTLFYAVNHTTPKPLEFPVKGGEYIGILFLSFFLTTYVHIVRKSKTNFKWLFLLGFFFLSGILIAPIRVYPLALFIVFIELYIFLKKPSFFTLKSSILRMLAIFLIPLIVFLYKPSAVVTYFVGFLDLYHKISGGNLNLLLTPLQGIGYSFLTDREWSWIFNPINLSRFKLYISSILVKPLLLFSIWTIFILRLTSKKLTKFFYISIFITVTLTSAIYFIGMRFWGADPNLRLFFDTTRLYSTTVGIFILSLAFLLYSQWKKTHYKNNTLLASFIGPFFSIIFITLTWFFAGATVSFASSQQYYLVVASLGLCLFSASILTLFYDKFKNTNNLTPFIILATTILVFKLSYTDVNEYFLSANKGGRDYQGQEMMQNKIKEKIKINRNYEPTLVYLDTSFDKANSSFYERTILTNFDWFMHIQNGRIEPGCIGLFYEGREKLKKIVTSQKGEVALTFNSVCIENGSIDYSIILPYKPKNFYAFKLKDFELIDIRSQVMKELNIKNN